MKRKKKKVPTLPNHITPIMPDPASGIDTFNNSCNTNDIGVGLVEDITYSNLETLKEEIVNSTIDYMLSVGFEDEDDARAYCDFDFEDEGDRFRCEVRAELGYDGMGELCNVLNPIVERYDKDAYFDFVDSGILEAYIYKGVSVIESLKRIDRNSISNNVYSDLTGLYESTQSKLDAKDKKKLADFVEKTDDINEVETYIKGLLSSKNESLLEYIEPTDEIEDEFDKSLHDCDRNIYDELPRWCQLYLDEFDGPWISYGRLPSGTYFYSDDYDTYFFDDLDDFIEDQKYNIRQVAEMYKDSPEDYDYSDEFVELLSSDLEKVLHENLLAESNGNLPDDIHNYDWHPSSPYYDGPEAQTADDFDSEIEIEFSQRGVLSNGYWNIDDFENDLTTAKFDVRIDYDGSAYFTLDDWEVQDALYEALNSDKIQQRLPLDLPGVYKVSGVISIPYSVENITYYLTSDKDWGDEYEYDFSDIHTNFYPENAAVEMINIERIADK